MTDQFLLTGKTCLVTGANRGIGRATAEGLAALGATVVLACRDTAAGEAVAAEINRRRGRTAARVAPVDLASQASIRSLAERLDAPRLDVLVNNAGVITPRRQETVDGFERQFAVNHLAAFLLTHLLRDRLVASAPARVVNVSSDAHFRGEMRWDDLQRTTRYRPFSVYAQSKLANVLFTRELARRLDGTGVTANSLHPGVIATKLLASAAYMPAFMVWLFRIPFASPAKGARTSIRLASAPDVAGVTGAYFRDGVACSPSRAAQDDAAARRLWDLSETMTGVA